MRSMAVMGVIFALVSVDTVSATCKEQNSTTMEQEMQLELDLSTLEERLRETPAIGFFTKLALKNNINNLLDTFQAYHKSESSKSLEQLRERYNLLLLKVQSLLQEEEPNLSQKIHASRDAIWCLLASPEEFSKLQAAEKI